MTNIEERQIQMPLFCAAMSHQLPVVHACQSSPQHPSCTQVEKEEAESRTPFHKKIPISSTRTVGGNLSPTPMGYQKMNIFRLGNNTQAPHSHATPAGSRFSLRYVLSFLRAEAFPQNPRCTQVHEDADDRIPSIVQELPMLEAFA